MKTLAEANLLARAIAPEAIGLQVFDTADLRRHAPAVFKFYGLGTGEDRTLGITSPAMGSSFGLEAPVFCINLAGVGINAEAGRKRRETEEDAFGRILQSIVLHEVSHVLARKPPKYFGDDDATAQGHTLEWGRIALALSIRATVHGYQLQSPHDTIRNLCGVSATTLWTAFLPQLESWRGDEIETLKAMPLPYIPGLSAAPASTGPFRTLPMLAPATA